MHILVLDTIHGGREIALHLVAMGHEVEALDVYRGVDHPTRDRYDCIVAPVHLNPEHPFRAIPSTNMITHHDAVAWVLESGHPTPFVEITGAKGKTTTAHALASLMKGRGILHTSRGTYQYPDRTLLWRKSITPASVLPAAQAAMKGGGWLIAEESLGVSGAGDLAILTSLEDYPIAANKRQALTAKKSSLKKSIRILTPQTTGMSHEIAVDDIVTVHGTTCTCRWKGVVRSFSNPLIRISGYRLPIALAAAAGCLLGIDPTPLGSFTALEGRMVVRREGTTIVVDNANSGIDVAGTIDTARYAREMSGDTRLTLVIGEESRTVCEGYGVEEMEKAIVAIKPTQIVLVGDRATALQESLHAPRVATLEEGYRLARDMTKEGSIVLAVKMWR